MQTPFQVKLPMVEELQIPGIKDAFVLSWKDFFLLKHYKTVINILNQVSDFSILWKKTFSKKSLTASSVFHPGAVRVQSSPPRPPYSPSPCFVPFSVAKSCLTLCDPRDCSMPGFLVLHYLKLMNVESVMPPNHLFLCYPFSPCPPSFPASESLPMSWLFASGGQSIVASASVLPMNIQSWFPLGLTGLILLLCKGLSRVFSNTVVQKHQFFRPILMSICDYWKNHSLDYMDLCWQSDVSAF